ncbi:hypothetical protein [Streptomyces sp. NPDC058755]|uniref:hypothetical protein n=1 Tax=Streptomyces sp. NPDC058755 TaxID=3346624 RepID=UPI003684B7D3
MVFEDGAGPLDGCVERLLATSEILLSAPRHFFRSYSAAEIGRLMTATAPRSVPTS